MSHIRSSAYKVVVGKSALTALAGFIAKKKYTSHYIICDDNTLQFCLPTVVVSCPQLANAEVIEIENGEASKSIEIVAQILQTFIENKADKNSLIINLGGGVVSDLGGFVASIYKRGVDFVNVPTSLLAMADASIGGKTGIDFGGIKNSVGTFAQPKAVFIHPIFLNTLPQRQLKNGLAEIYKIALVSDKKFWDQLKNVRENTLIEKTLTRSLQLKNDIVLKDPFDRASRKVLNFGHTIGHAIESLYVDSAEALLHGEAVVIGMIVESHIAFQKKLLKKNELLEIIDVLFNKFKPKALVSALLPDTLERIRNDKKTANKSFNFSLPCKIGTCKYDISVRDSQIKNALLFYNRLFK